MKAVIIKERGINAVVDVPTPETRPGYVTVKTVAVAVNPTDFHHLFLEHVGRVGGISGCDLSGIVEDIGPDCTSTVKKGDKVYGVCHGANLNDGEHGAFAEYALVRDGHLAKIPEGMSFEQAATLGVGVTSVGQVLHLKMGHSLPDEGEKKPATILIYGGSAATATLAIQFAKLSGLTVITTASEKNRELVESRGPDLVLDYKSPDFAQKLRDFSNLQENSDPPKPPLRYVLDCISTLESYRVIADALPEKDADQIQLVALLPLKDWPRNDIKTSTILAYTTFGEFFHKFGEEWAAEPETFAFGKKWWKLAAELIAQGHVKPHPVELRKNGFAGVLQGILDVKPGGTVSGVKLVYRVDETGEGARETLGHQVKISAGNSLESNWNV